MVPGLDQGTPSGVPPILRIAPLTIHPGFSRCRLQPADKAIKTCCCDDIASSDALIRTQSEDGFT